MDAPAPPPNDAKVRRSFVDWLRAMPRWKKWMVGIALAALVIGGVWSASTTSASGPGPDAQGRSSLATSLVPGGDEPAPTTTAEPAAKGVFRIGFSFLAGFCLGAFLRATLRLAAIAFGFWLLMTLTLSYYGLVVVDWHAIEGVWNRFTSNVGDEAGDFQRFLTGSLPAVGLATTGLVVGLKKH